jgi:hypothetical protein
MDFFHDRNLHKVTPCCLQKQNIKQPDENYSVGHACSRFSCPGHYANGATKNIKDNNRIICTRKREKSPLENNFSFRNS